MDSATDAKITRLYAHKIIMVQDISLAVGPRLKEEIYEVMYDNPIYKKDRMDANANYAKLLLD